MKDQKKPAAGGTSGFVKVLYVISAILMAVFVYMAIVNAMYISNYAATYGLKVSDMIMDAVQYVITGSISYFVYGLLVFCAGKIIGLLQQKPEEAPEDDGADYGTDDVSEDSLESEDAGEDIKNPESAEEEKDTSSEEESVQLKK